MSIIKVCDFCGEDLQEAEIYYSFTERHKDSKNRGFGGKHCCLGCIPMKNEDTTK